MKNNINGLWYNLSRAYEIARLGNYKIKVVFGPEYVEGAEDFKEIKAFFGQQYFGEEGDMIIEIVKPDDYNPKRTFEILEKINERADRAKNNRKPEVFAGPSCDSLLKVATERLNFSLPVVNTIKKIAGTIAQLHGGETISPEHVAEAIHYQCPPHEFIAPENSTINFGKGIQISCCKLDINDIESAIKYLNKLK